MKTWKIITIVTLTILAAVLVTGTVYAYTGGGMMGNFGNHGAPTGTAGNYGYYGGGMMGGGGMMSGYGYYPQTTVPAQPNAGNSYVPPTYANGTSAAPMNITTAETIANNYLASQNNPNLAVKEIEEYSLNFYVQYYEKNTGIGAFETLINPYTGAITPEMGPNMMWNTKYGMMSGSGYGGMMGAGGMMGGYGYGYGNGYTGTPTADMPVNAIQASADAQQWLNSNIAGATVGEVFPFYGYYHVMAMVNGTNYGMMSVNGYSGQIWYHTWHGTFIQALDLS